MNKLNLWNSKSGRVSLDFNPESKALKSTAGSFKLGKKKTDRSKEFDGSVSQVVDAEIKEAEKKLQYYGNEA